MSVGYKDDTAPAHTEKSCFGIREVLSLVGDKWSVLIVSLLEGGEQRFNELRHQVDGISQRMLTLTLRQLERNGLVSRRVEASVPPRVFYALTPLGRTLLEPVKEMIVWAQANHPKMVEAQKRYDANENRLAG